MRAQLSLELMLVVLSSIVMLSAMLPAIGKARGAGDYSLISRNAQLIADKLYYSCQRSILSGTNQTVSVLSLSNFSVSNASGSLEVRFANISILKEGFPCRIDVNLTRGSNTVLLSPHP